MATNKTLEKKRKAAARAAQNAKDAADLAKRLAAEVEALEKEEQAGSTVSLSSSEEAPPAKKDSEMANESSDDGSSSDDDSSDEDEEETPKVIVKKEPEAKETSTSSTKKAPVKPEETSDDDSSSDSGSSSDSEDDEEEEVEKLGKSTKKEDPVVKKEDKEKDTKEAKGEKDDDDESSSSSSGGSSSSSSSDSDDDDEENTDNKNKDTKMADDVSTPTKDASGTKRAAAPFTPDNDKRQTGTKIYVRGLPWRASEDEVRDYFVKCGPIESLELPLQDDGRSSGTAIVEFKEQAGASAAIELNGEDFQGRWLSIKYSTPREILSPRGASEKPEGCTTVFVGNLSFQIDEDSLREAFAECGEISMIRFATDRETGDFKGFGHIEFVDTESTDKAMAMAGTDILGRAVRVDYAVDKRRGSFGGDRGGRGRGFGGRSEYMGSGGGRGKGRGRGRGTGGRSGGGMVKAKKSGAISEFSGNKITF